MIDLSKGDDASVDDMGCWTEASDQRTLALFGGGEAPLKFVVQDANTLRVLDAEGRELASSLSSKLSRTLDIPPRLQRRLMRGMYMYFADADRFTECLTRQNWPVAQEQDNAALEFAYVQARRQPGEAILVSPECRVAMRPKMEGDGQQTTLVVERFLGIWRGESCGTRFSTALLENAYWKLTRLGDALVTVVSQQREPHVILNPETRRVGGSGGCNRLLGSYELHGDKLTFGQMAGHHDGLCGRQRHREGLPGGTEAGEHVEDHGTPSRVV